MQTLWEKKTGKALRVEAVDAREIMRQSPSIYTDVEPGTKGQSETDTSLTMSQLREALGQKGVQIPVDARKDELQKLLDDLGGPDGDTGDDKMTVVEIKAALLAKGIEYPAAAKKAELLELLEGAGKA